MEYEDLDYAGWPEPWWSLAFTVSEDFWDALMDMNQAMGRDMVDTSL